MFYIGLYRGKHGNIATGTGLWHLWENLLTFERIVIKACWV